MQRRSLPGGCRSCSARRPRRRFQQRSYRHPRLTFRPVSWLRSRGGGDPSRRGLLAQLDPDVDGLDGRAELVARQARPCGWRPQRRGDPVVLHHRWWPSLSTRVTTLAERRRRPSALDRRPWPGDRGPARPQRCRSGSIGGLWDLVHRPAGTGPRDDRSVRRTDGGLSCDVAPTRRGRAVRARRCFGARNHSGGFDRDASAVAPLHGDRSALVLALRVRDRPGPSAVGDGRPVTQSMAAHCAAVGDPDGRREAAGGQLRHINRSRTARRSGAVGARPPRTACLGGRPLGSRGLRLAAR